LVRDFFKICGRNLFVEIVTCEKNKLITAMAKSLGYPIKCNSTKKFLKMADQKMLINVQLKWSDFCTILVLIVLKE
jgi:hypothetical protein